jgi:cytochrome c553
MRPITVCLVAIVSFGLGVAAQRVFEHTRRGSVTAGAKPDDVVAVDFENEPLWAYGFSTIRKSSETASPQSAPTRRLRPNEAEAEQTRLRTVSGSAASYSLLDVRDYANLIDWFPGDHPAPMPSVIAHGPAASVEQKWACGSCHLPNGMGRPENAPPGGLPVAYFIRQLQDFRNGRRRTADPRKPNTNTMIALARVMTDQEMREAAEYFTRTPYVGRTRVVETDSVPSTRIVGNLFLPTSIDKTEPIGGRIIEVPEDESQTELLRNPHVGFVAYVPPGSIERGRDLVTTGGMRIVGDTVVQGRTTPCVTCHGLDLLGVTDVPPIAGRSASYITRQMWDIQQGTRNGEAVQLMKMAIARLTVDDLTAIAAYVASRPTSPASQGGETSR